MRNLFLLCLLVIARPLSAEVNESLAYTYYVANDDSTRSLLSILNNSSPNRQHGEIYHAHTSWYVKWGFRWFENTDGRCRITGVTTEVTGSINLPQLVGATSMHREQFDRYLSALRVHELGHYDIANKAAALIDGKILSLPEMPSCKALESTANDFGYRTLREYKDKEIRYDASTAHGRSQGAWLEK